MSREPDIRVVHRDNGRRAICRHIDCTWISDRETVESDAFWHAANNPGHTAIVEASWWEEYTLRTPAVADSGPSSG